jgi:hypothetical protein
MRIQGAAVGCIASRVQRSALPELRSDWLVFKPSSARVAASCHEQLYQDIATKACHPKSLAIDIFAYVTFFPPMVAYRRTALAGPTESTLHPLLIGRCKARAGKCLVLDSETRAVRTYLTALAALENEAPHSRGSSLS